MRGRPEPYGIRQLCHRNEKYFFLNRLTPSEETRVLKEISFFRGLRKGRAELKRQCDIPFSTLVPSLLSKFRLALIVDFAAILYKTSSIYGKTLLHCSKTSCLRKTYARERTVSVSQIPVTFESFKSCRNKPID